MMCQEFWLCRHSLRKLRFQEVGNALMRPLSRALQQRLICRIPDQSVFEDIGRVRWRTSLIHNLRFNELPSSGCNIVSSNCETAWSSSYGNCRPITAASWAIPLR